MVMDTRGLSAADGLASISTHGDRGVSFSMIRLAASLHHPGGRLNDPMADAAPTILPLRGKGHIPGSIRVEFRFELLGVGRELPGEGEERREYG